MFVPCSLQKTEKRSTIFDILLFVDSPLQSACLLVRVCPWRLVVPLRQRGRQPIPLRRPHLRRKWRRPSRLRQRLRHSSLSPNPPKWIPLPLRQPPRPLMERSLLSPVVCRLLSMLMILSKKERQSEHCTPPSSPTAQRKSRHQPPDPNTASTASTTARSSTMRSTVSKGNTGASEGTATHNAVAEGNAPPPVKTCCAEGEASATATHRAEAEA